MRVCTLGDLALDVVVRLAAPIAVGGDTDADIHLSPGGQAANVAAWAAALGASAAFIGQRGDDAPGRLTSSGLEARGVDVLGPAATAGRGAVICSIVSPDGERSMAADRGAAPGLRADEIDPAWLGGCDHLFVSGYALMHEPARSAALRAAAAARAAGALVSVDLASWSAIRDVGAEAFRSVVGQLAPDVAFANEDEERTVGGPLPGTRWILKRGSRGCTFEGEERRPHAVDAVVDTTGAGDALAAGWMVGGPELALEAAARCVATLGSMP